MFRGRRDLLLLNLVLAVFYAGFCIVFGVYGDRDQLLVAGDSNSYEAVSDWILGGPANGWLEVRPFLYPFLVACSKAIGGYGAIWAMQVFLWFAAVNFLYATLLMILHDRRLAFGTALLMGLSLSLVSCTVLLLTEILAVFLFSVVVWYAVKHAKDLWSGAHPVNIFGLLVLLALVKPQTVYLLAPVLIVAVWCVVRRWDPARAIRLAMFTVPLIVQLGIVHRASGEWSLSRIGPITIRDYFFSQGMAEIEAVPFATANETARAMTSEERSAYMRTHVAEFAPLFLKNVGDNLSVGSFSLPLLLGSRNLTIRSYAYYVPALFGRLLLLLHVLMLFPIAWVLLRSLRHRNKSANWLLIAIPLLLLGALTTGISFWQADRLTITITPLYIAIYAFILREVVMAVLHSRKNILQ